MKNNDFLSGKKLYGDDLPQNMIDQWYEDESEGYSNLNHQDSQEPVYVYHELNKLHGFSQLPSQRFFNVLGVGSAYGEEFKPIIDKIEKLTVLDPSEKFVRDNIFGKPVNYIKPVASGKMPFNDESFDLCICLGALHHIPNVTFVVSEIYRSLIDGGFALIREPVVSMGDWTKPRPGLTKHERGIPLDYFRQLLVQTGFQVLSERLCIFPPLPKITNAIGIAAFNSRLLTKIDFLLSLIVQSNNAYHRTTFIEKLSPSNVYYVLQKI